LYNDRAIRDSSSPGKLPDLRARLGSAGLLPARLLLHVPLSPRSYQGAYKSRKLIIEVVLALLASAGLGSAIFFLGLSVGIYM